jgi:hypothetical protein
MKNIYVHSWNFHPKNVNGLKLLIQYLNLNIVNTIDEADIIYSVDRALDATKYPNKKFIFGPQFSVYPNKDFFSLNNKFNNIVYIQPSNWVIELWNEFDAQKINVPLLPAPFPVDIIKFTPYDNPRDKVSIYFKHRKQQELKFVQDFLHKQNISPIIISYSNRYTEEDYIKFLNQSKFVIWIGSHESQGFALEEALSSNVPLLVWNVRHMSQEVGNNCHHVKSGATTIPYWDERCGEFFYSSEELQIKYDLLLSKLNEYRPRDFILENLNVVKCYENYWINLL